MGWDSESESGSEGDDERWEQEWCVPNGGGCFRGFDETTHMAWARMQEHRYKDDIFEATVELQAVLLAEMSWAAEEL